MVAMVVQVLRPRIRWVLRKLSTDEAGLEMIEIVLIGALVVIATLFTWRALGKKIKDVLDALMKEMNP